MVLIFCNEQSFHAGLAGYSHVTGGYAGGQAEYARVPNADVNLLKVPADASLPDDKVLFLSDIFATAWHANVLGEVSDGDKVAIWGAGPGRLFPHSPPHQPSGTSPSWCEGRLCSFRGQGKESRFMQA